MQALRSRTIIGIAVVLIAANMFVYRELFSTPPLTVTVLETGKESRAILVREKRGATILIDTGPDAKILRLLGGAMPEWQRRIDAVVLTRITADTTGGLPDVLSRYSIGYLVRSPVAGSRSQEALLAEAVKAEHGLRDAAVSRGMRVTAGKRLSLEILWPPLQRQARPNAKTMLNYALAFCLSYGDTSFLIENGLSSAAASRLADFGTCSQAPAITISSSTPAKVFVSNGKTITAP